MAHPEDSQATSDDELLDEIIREMRRRGESIPEDLQREAERRGVGEFQSQVSGLDIGGDEETGGAFFQIAEEEEVDPEELREQADSFANGISNRPDPQGFVQGFEEFLREQDVQLNLPTRSLEQEGSPFNVFGRQPVNRSPRDPFEFVRTLQEEGDRRQQKLGQALEKLLIEEGARDVQRRSLLQRKRRQQFAEQLRKQQQQKSKNLRKSRQNFIDNQSQLSVSSEEDIQRFVDIGLRQTRDPKLVNSLLNQRIQDGKFQNKLRLLDLKNKALSAKSKELGLQLDINKEQRLQEGQQFRQRRHLAEMDPEERIRFQIQSVNQQLQREDDLSEEERTTLQSVKKQLQGQLKQVKEQQRISEIWDSESEREFFHKEVMKNLSAAGLDDGIRETTSEIQSIAQEAKRISKARDDMNQQEAIRNISQKVSMISRHRDMTVKNALERYKEMNTASIAKRGLERVKNKESRIRQSTWDEANIEKEFSSSNEDGIVKIMGKRSPMDAQFNKLNENLRKIQEANFDRDATNARIKAIHDDLNKNDNPAGKRLLGKFRVISSDIKAGSEGFDDDEGSSSWDQQIINYYNAIGSGEPPDDISQLKKVLQAGNDPDSEAPDLLDMEELNIPAKLKVIRDGMKQIIGGKRADNLEKFRQAAAMISDNSIIMTDEGPINAHTGEFVEGDTKFRQVANDIPKEQRNLAKPQQFRAFLDEVNVTPRNQKILERAYARALSTTFQSNRKFQVGESLMSNQNPGQFQNFMQKAQNLQINDQDYLTFLQKFATETTNMFREANRRKHKLLEEALSRGIPTGPGGELWDELRGLTPPEEAHAINKGDRFIENVLANRSGIEKGLGQMKKDFVRVLSEIPNLFHNAFASIKRGTEQQKNQLENQLQPDLGGGQ